LRTDNGYLVAWHSNMNYKIGKASRKLTTSVLSGEGFMTVFTGPGTIYVQTRSLQACTALSIPPLFPLPFSPCMCVCVCARARPCLCEGVRVRACVWRQSMNGVHFLCGAQRVAPSCTLAFWPDFDESVLYTGAGSCERNQPLHDPGGNRYKRIGALRCRHADLPGNNCRLSTAHLAQRDADSLALNAATSAVFHRWGALLLND
jgi:hypothetical protein